MSLETPLLYQWVISIRGLKKDQPDLKTSNMTHTLMDGNYGGIFFIPDQYHLDFLDRYADNLHSSFKFYLSEIRTKNTFKYYIDLDIKRTELPQNDPILQQIPWEFKKLCNPSIDAMIQLYVQSILTVLPSYYPNLPQDQWKHVFETWVCKRPIEYGQNEQSQKTCNVGVHMYFPNLHVIQEHALHIRMGVINYLYEKYNTLLEKTQNAWEDIFDEGVYDLGKGLRMYGSSKCIKCTECKRKNNYICNKCFGNQRIHIDRRYELYYRAYYKPPDALEINYQIPCIRDCIHATSIRLVPEQPPNAFFQIPEGTLPLVIHNHNSTKSKVITTIVKRGRTFNATPSQLDQLQTFIRQHLGIRAYHAIIVKRITKVDQGYFIMVCGKGSRYCINYGKDHRSVSIYFHMTSDGLVQRCTCKCKTTEGRSYGQCSMFKSKLFPLTNELSQSFYYSSSYEDIYMQPSRHKKISDILNRCMHACRVKLLQNET